MTYKGFGIIIGLTLLTVANVGVATAKPTPSRVECPRGYVERDVRAYGQRLESDPRPALNPVLVQNDWEDPDDHRFVVLRACVRPLSNDENMELFRWGSRQ